MASESSSPSDRREQPLRVDETPFCYSIILSLVEVDSDVDEASWSSPVATNRFSSASPSAYPLPPAATASPRRRRRDSLAVERSNAGRDVRFGPQERRGRPTAGRDSPSSTAGPAVRRRPAARPAVASVHGRSDLRDADRATVPRLGRGSVDYRPGRRFGGTVSRMGTDVCLPVSDGVVDPGGDDSSVCSSFVRRSGSRRCSVRSTASVRPWLPSQRRPWPRRTGGGRTGYL